MGTAEPTAIDWPLTISHSIILALLLGSVTYIPTTSIPLTVFTTVMYLIILPTLTIVMQKYSTLQQQKLNGELTDGLKNDS